MGVADAMGPLSEAVRQQYQVTNVMATLLSFFVFIAFAVFSVPGALLAARIGMKKLLLLGLGLNVVAMAIPSMIQPGFGLLLACIFTLGVGTTFLQVAANPIMRDVSAAGAYSRNLSFAQGFKGIGSALSTYLVTAIAGLVLIQGMGWRAAFPLFLILMLIPLVLVLKLKTDEAAPQVPPSMKSSLGLLKEPVFFKAVLGIFLYVGAEVCMARFLFPAMKDALGSEAEASKFGPALFFILLTVGRLTGGAVLAKVGARVCFRISAFLGLAGAALLMTGSATGAIAGVFAAGLGFANIWPLLFSLTVEERPERAGELSGLMCMAISGGALVPLAMGYLVDIDMKSLAFIVPTLCFTYLLAISLKSERKALG